MYLERKMPKVGTNEVFKGKKAMEKVILLLLKLGIHKLRSNQQGATKILRGFKHKERLNDINKGTRDSFRGCKTLGKVKVMYLADLFGGKIERSYV